MSPSLLAQLDSQDRSEPGSEMSVASAQNVLLSEQLREFESIFERVAGSSHFKDHDDSLILPDRSSLRSWGDDGLFLADRTHKDHQEGSMSRSWPDEGSFLTGTVEYLVDPPSNFSSAPIEADESTSRDADAGGGAVTEDDDQDDDGSLPTPATPKTVPAEQQPPEAPLMQLLTVASAARLALEDEEKENGLRPESPGAEPAIPAPADSSDAADPPATSMSIKEELLEDAPEAPGQVKVTPTPSAASVKTEGSKRKASKNSPAVSPGPSTAGGSPTKAAPVAAPAPTGAAAAAAAAGVAAAGAAKAPTKAHDDEITVLRVNAILEEYREQLRNSPDLQNKPAPRRRSNPLPSPSATPKRRKSVQSKSKTLPRTNRSGSDNNSDAGGSGGGGCAGNNASGGSGDPGDPSLDNDNSNQNETPTRMDPCTPENGISSAQQTPSAAAAAAVAAAPTGAAAVVAPIASAAAVVAPASAITATISAAAPRIIAASAGDVAAARILTNTSGNFN